MTKPAASIDSAAWSSPWRDVRVRDKGSLVVILLGCALLGPPFPAAPIVLGAVTVIAVLWARVPVRLWLIAVTAQAGFLLLSGVGLAVQVSWTPLRVWATDESLWYAAGIMVRALAAGSATMLLAFTTPMVEVLMALRRVGVPQAVVDVAAVAYRMTFALADSARSIRAAQQARLGLTTWRSQITSAADIMATILARAWRHTARLEAGLAGRGDGALTVLSEPRRRYLLPLLAGVGVAIIVAGATWAATTEFSISRAQAAVSAVAATPPSVVVQARTG